MSNKRGQYKKKKVKVKYMFIGTQETEKKLRYTFNLIFNGIAKNQTVI